MGVGILIPGLQRIPAPVVSVHLTLSLAKGQDNTALQLQCTRPLCHLGTADSEVLIVNIFIERKFCGICLQSTLPPDAL